MSVTCEFHKHKVSMMIEVFQNMNVFLTENHRATLFRRQPNSPVVIVQGTEQTYKQKAYRSYCLLPVALTSSYKYSGLFYFAVKNIVVPT